MRILLDYGRTGLEVDLPENNVAAVLRQQAATPLSDPETALRSALAAPIKAAPLAEVARGRRSACIVICDITRPVPNSFLLPPILETIEQAGITRNAITILIATGTHRPNLGAEAEALVGAGIASNYRICNHACRDESMHVSLGTSPAGVPVRLDRRYVEADLRITIGLIEPHFMAGFSGGRKLIMPGIAAEETIQSWHSPRFLESPLARAGSVDGNPVHEESLAIARILPPDLIVDVTLDEQNRITGIFAGELATAWQEGVSFVKQYVSAEMDEPADIVVTSNAGAPLDATFYQTVKGMVNAVPVVKRGGDIIIASRCQEGLGSADFSRLLLETEDLDEFVDRISRPGPFYPEQWQVEELAMAARHACITCVTEGITADTLANCFVTSAETVEEAVNDALEKHGKDARIAVIPHGPYVIPAVRRSA
jgi:nickel-dependent lactate racemase